jgi:voltage-gated potassium channel Kch
MPADPTHVDRGDFKGLAYEVFMLGLAVLSIVNLGLMAVFEWQSQHWWLVLYVDAVLTIFFVGDFVYRLVTATSKGRYLGRGGGVLDLVSCAPGLRILRLFRIVRAARIFRRLGGIRMLGELRQQVAAGTVYLVVFTGIVVLEVTGLLQLRFEEDAPGANITNAGDALWWGYVTATTVGYGDQFPVTVGGRIVGFLMLTVGVALFATFSGFLANTFLSAKQSAPPPTDETELATLLRDVERLHGEQQQAIAALRALVDEPPSGGVSTV